MESNLTNLLFNPNLPFNLDFLVSEILLLICAIIMILTCLRLVLSKTLLSSIILMSVFSLLIGICYLFLDAPDVAMTETALGACLSSCVLLNLVKIVGEEVEDTKKIRVVLASIICLVFLAALVWAGLDLPQFGDPDSPLQQHVTKYYVENTRHDIGIPSMVAAVLASYRGFDTLGETTVILVAGLGVILILNRRKTERAGTMTQDSADSH